MSLPSSVMRNRPEGPGIRSELLDALHESAARAADSGTPDPQALAGLRASELLSVAVPTAYGGQGGDTTQVNRTVEEVAAVNPSVAIVLFQHCAVAARIAEWGSPEQRSALLPALATGDVLAASAWSETGAGAAKKRLATSARRLSGDRWLLDGGKSFTTGAGIADLYLVLVRTSEANEDSNSLYGSAGQSFFLVPANNPGLVPDLGLDLVGMRGSATGFVSLVNCEVGERDRLGPLGEATAIIAGVRQTGATLGAVSVGIAQAAHDLALRHCERTGLLERPAVRHRLIELGTQIEAARALVERAGARTASDPGTATLHSKLFASSVGEQTALEVARMLGSAGYIVGHELNRLLSDARAVALMGPTNDLCRELVGAAWAP